MEVSGWVQVSFGFCVCGKSSQNSPKPVLIFWSGIPCVHTLLKGVGYYDLTFHVSDWFPQQINWMGGWGELYPIFFLDFWNL